MTTVLLLNAHALRIPLPDESVHCVVTSPPYWGLRDYGLPPLVWAGAADCDHAWGDELVTHQRGSVGDHSTLDGGLQAGGAGRLQAAQQGQFCPRCAAWRGCLGLEPTPELYVAHLVLLFREVRRVLRTDGTLWLNLGDSYQASKGYSGHGGLEFQQRRAQSGLSFSNPAAHVGGPGRIRPQDRPHPVLKPKDMVGIPWRVVFALQDDGWWLRSDIIWHKPNGMPESVTDRPTKAHEYLFLLTKSERYFYDADAIRRPHKEASLRRQARASGDPHSLSRPRPNIRGLRTALEALDEGHGLHPAGRNRRTVWTIPTASYSGAHFATFPPALVKPCIEAGASARGVCPTCGAPWERVVERQFVPQADVSAARGVRGSNGQKRPAFDAWAGCPRGTTRATTVGWLPSCACYGTRDVPRYPPMPDEAEAPVYCALCGGEGQVALWGFMAGQVVDCRACRGRGLVGRPNRAWLAWRAAWEAVNRQRAALVGQYADCATARAVVLDPFVGSGTTLLVARTLGRCGVGLDLSFDYLHAQARQRLQLDALAEWRDGRQAEEATWDTLPLFAPLAGQEST